MCHSRDDWHCHRQAVGQEEYNHNEIIQILTDAKVHQQVCSISPSVYNKCITEFYSISLEYAKFIILFFEFGICSHSKVVNNVSTHSTG